MWIGLLFLTSVSGEDLTLRTVNALGRPLADVKVTVRCLSGREIAFRSDQAGMIRELYRDCAASSVTVQKDGYETFTTTGLRDFYRLTRIVLDTEASVRKFLGSDYEYRDAEIFRNEARLRPILRRLTGDSQFASTARHLLALIAEPSDLRRLLSLPPPSDPSGSLLRYSLASSLIALRDDRMALDFLHRCAHDDPDDNWAKAGAMQTLNLMRENLSGPDLELLAERVATAIDAGEWQRNGKAQFNQAKDKALIEMTFHAGLDMLVYTATFHKAGTQWSLRAARQTMQGRMPAVYVLPFEPPPQLKPQQP